MRPVQRAGTDAGRARAPRNGATYRGGTPGPALGLPASALTCRAADLPCFAVVVLAALTEPVLAEPLTFAAPVDSLFAFLDGEVTTVWLPPNLAECAE